MIYPVKSSDRVVTLEEGLLFTLAGSAKFVKEFPILQRLRGHSVNGAGCCDGGPALLARSAVINAVKAGLVGMDDQRRQRLKTMLNATQVAVVVLEGSSVRRKLI